MDEFEQLTSGLNDLFDDVNIDEITDYSKAELPVLVNRLAEIDLELKRTATLLSSNTPESRELHSERAAIVIELRNRGVMG